MIRKIVLAIEISGLCILMGILVAMSLVTYIFEKRKSP